MTALDVNPDLRAAVDAEVWAALGTVLDPELDEPITDLGFVRSHEVSWSGDGTRAVVDVHLRLPTSFCAPNFAYLMASDAYDVLIALPEVQSVVVALDDHHDSDKINAGLAAGLGYRGTFDHEAEDSLEELRLVFQRKAHTAAMERVCTALVRDQAYAVTDLHRVRLADLPADGSTEALLRRRRDLGFTEDPDAPVMVDDSGRPYPADEVPLRLRFARTTRISIDGNAHFCRGLLQTRYPGAEGDQAPRAQDLPTPVLRSTPTAPTAPTIQTQTPKEREI